MEAKEFVYGLRRMCKFYDNGNCYKNVGTEEVESCPMLKYNCGNIDDLSDESFDIVEEWVEQHPLKTRQTELLKIYPNARMWEDDDFLGFCPKNLDTEKECTATCRNCCKEYWSKEIE